ncbi:TonB-dependent receptor [Sphingomonas sp. H39-1-10]|uniref:TonB-dependent receptor plug domain-containing protein n=1 Tax=Sphingomonas pollutisoli TaxID=3030829 RepID=UPI0023B95105|nr:TonB-dependent receptor [Sphingomonas pollutisoli]MDF0488325.1 TonB-dependent receptor [Sphingomonas pollutisoli]
MHSVQTTLKNRLLLGAAPLAALASFAAPAFAQDQAAPAPATLPSDTPAAQDDTKDIVVTGSLFARRETDSPSPITVLTTENLQKAGITNISDAIRSVSADSAGSIGNGFQSGFSAGGSAISLRGLGVSSTVVLVDGLRSANFPLNDDGHNAYVDLNSIPITNIERVEVLKDSASATYGADAIGGVVNIITKKHITGLAGGIEGGLAEKGDAQKYKAHLSAGYGDYETQGFNVYVTGEYEFDGRVNNHDRGFPFNTLDLTSIGGVDNNRADDSLTTATADAIVTRVRQTNLNNPLAGSVANASTPALFQTLTPLSNCNFGTFTVNTATQQGTACKHNLQDEYRQILPLQERYGFSARASLRLSDTIEGYLQGSFMHDRVDIISPPNNIRQVQPFGGSPSLSASNPGIVLPVWICNSGVNCATDLGAAGRRLNPNNPYAAAYANDPANGAARIYYLFGDARSGSSRTNEVYRISGGLNGHFGDSWVWKVDAVYAQDNLSLTDYGWYNTNALINAINTGSYNFVNPSLNSQAVRDAVLPPINTRSHSWIATVDASIGRTLFALPGGDAKIAVGGQYRRESLTNNSRNPGLDVNGLNTSAAFGDREVAAGFFQIDAPILTQLNDGVSGRYDHYSEGYDHFSPKVEAQFKPVEFFSIRGTFSKGFRAPTFAESNPRSSYAGFSNYTPNAAFVAAHPGNSAYSTIYSLGSGATGNPNVQPEKSRSFTVGGTFQPTRRVSFTVDYFNIKKSDLIVTGPLGGAARSAYYSVASQKFASSDAAAAAGCAALAAVGQGYSCNVVDAADPFNPTALPRLLIYNVPYVNADYEIISGLDFAAQGQFDLTSDIHYTTRAEVTHTLQFDLHTNGTVQKYAGTLGPQELSSGNGTPNWRGSWQNTIEYGKLALTTTTYWIGRLKEVAADEGTTDLSCASALYKAADGSDKFCYVHSFIYTDFNANVHVNDNFDFYINVGNILGARAPIAPAGYTSSPNYLTSWHTPGLIGRTFRAGANFKF